MTTQYTFIFILFAIIVTNQNNKNQYNQ